ncbi:MAG: hypothetical protein WC497_03055 [Patescibacteria group bacterium]
MAKKTPSAKKLPAQPQTKAQIKTTAPAKTQTPAKQTNKSAAPMKAKAPTRPVKINSYLIWAIIIITAVLAYTMIWVSYWYKSGLDELTSSSVIINHNSNTNTTTNANANVNGAIVPPTTAWSTYENTQYGYTIKYPNTWADENTSIANPAMFADPVAIAQETDTELLQGTKVEIYVENSSASNVAAAVLAKDTEWTVLQETQTVVDSIAAVRRQVQALSFTNVTYILKNNKLYSIIQYIPKLADRGMYTAIYGQILANFSFTQ